MIMSFGTLIPWFQPCPQIWGMDSNQILTSLEILHEILGWHRYAKLGGSLPLADAAIMGKQATKFCKEYEIDMGEVPAPRFGRVRTYPKWVLDSLFCPPSN
jgi:hypothetical protein